MSIAESAIQKRTVTIFTTLVALIAGLLSFGKLGKLEDPEFTVKTAVILTSYAGASAAEVELEVTDRIEMAVQEMPQLKEIESFSRPGLSLVKVFIKPSYSSNDLPQIWDELRKKVSDATPQLPPGTGVPVVSDDFGDVYGFFMAVVGDGYSPAQLKEHVDDIKKELSLVPGVARVELWGDQKECIYLDVEQARIAQLGLVAEDVVATLQRQNMVVDGGGLDLQTERMRMTTTGEFDSPEDIADLVIRGVSARTIGENDRLFRIGDIATVRHGYVEPTAWAMRHNGLPSIGISCSTTSGVNVIDVGAAIDRRLEELKAELPIGIEFERISWQSDQVSDAINAFMISLLQAVAIVLVVLWVAMGLRTALVVGMGGLVFVILISLLFMGLFNIDLQRMSLGALVIAMGMMVDNAIVVSDGILVRLQQGMDRVKAAAEAATLPSIPLLGATIIAVAAFYPIAASDESAGEYCATLFSVVAISLLISWVLSVTITPVMCIALLPGPKPGAETVDPYSGKLFRLFAWVLRLCIRLKWLVMFVMIGVLAVSGFAFQWVDQMFFPASARAQFMVDYWAPEGTRIQETSNGLIPIEEMLAARDEIDSISTFVGQGPPRFYLPVEPESPYSSYGQLIVNVHDYRTVDTLIQDLMAWSRDNVSEARVVPRKYGLGPSETWPVEARFIGPGSADAETLRGLGARGEEFVAQSPHAGVARTGWRQRVKKVVADYDDANARWTRISRAEIAIATRRAFDGNPIGLYREDDKLMPIIARHVQPERERAAESLESLQVRPPMASESVPLSTVTRSIDVEWEDPLIWRFDRKRYMAVQAVPKTLATTLRDDVIADLESVELPPGYELFWDGEFRSSRDAQQSLIPGMIPAFVIVAVIIVGLFNAYRPPLIILCVIPFAAIGITVGLLATGQPFGFVALLGAMSLAGMMIKNAIVLLDQVKIEKEEGKSDYEAIMASALSRLRPVLLAAGTTVLGVVPLLGDVFWVAMAVVIMFGLSFGSILTMILIPVLYAIFYRIKVE